MTKLIKSIGIIICVLLMVSLAACGNIDEKINEATAPLNEKITSLKGQITDLNSEISDLEGQIEALESSNSTLKSDRETIESAMADLGAAKAALEEEKAVLEEEKAALEAAVAEKNIALKCAKGEHVWTGEGEIEYTWEKDISDCYASFDCKNCEKDVSISSHNIIYENGTAVAEFGDIVPSKACEQIAFTGATFNSDSACYFESSNTFAVTRNNSLVITFNGVNLDKIDENNDLLFGINNGAWKNAGNIYNTDNNAFTIEKATITVVFSYDYVEQLITEYGSIYGVMLFDNTGTSIGSTIIQMNVELNPINIDSEGCMLVSDKSELSYAVSKGGNIRFAADIESDEGFTLFENAVIDLAGYDLKIVGEGSVSIWCYANCELTDSVGGATINRPLLINDGTLALSGAIQIIVGDKTLMINGSAVLDLSDYTGEELYVYVSNMTNIIIPENYAFFDDDINIGSYFEDVKELDYVYIRAVDDVQA